MDLMHRVRWGNVARALAVAAVVGLVVAWPRLRSESPAIPDPAPPAAAAEAPAIAEPSPPVEREPRRPARPRRSAAPRRRAKPRRSVQPRRSVVAPAPSVAPAPVVVAPAPAPPSGTPTEFGFESAR